ncbi:MAG: ABC transporter permease [Thermomicrobiales bacterium]
MAAIDTLTHEEVETIEAAAFAIVARDGVARATLPAIATEAGAELDLVRAVFATEADVVRALLLRASAMDLTPIMDETPGGEDTLNLRDIARVLVAAPVPAERNDRASVFDFDIRAPASRPSLAPQPMSSELTLLSSPPHERGGKGGVPVGESVGSALHSLAANKLRTLLTMLGIIIGVGSVVGLLAIGNGVTRYITGELEKNGTNLVLIRGQAAKSNGVSTGQRVASLSVEDAQALADPAFVPDGIAVSPEVSRGGQIAADSANFFATINGVWPEYAVVHNIDTGGGDFIAASDLGTNGRVVVLGSKVAEALYGADGANATGRMIKVAGVGMRVLAVLPAGGGVNSPDEQVFVPLTTYLNVLFGDQANGAVTNHGKVVNVIWVKATSEKTADAAAAEVKDTLTARHRLAAGADADFQVDTEADLLKQVQTILFLLQVFLAFIAGISLLVGGIGIMNIMLVSVTERTREIGIRKAIGARQRDILVQFIIEAMLIGLFGAMVGVAFGFGIALLVSAVWKPSAVSVGSIIVAVSVAVMTAMVFGVFPARRAARLRPIDALRYE